MQTSLCKCYARQKNGSRPMLERKTIVDPRQPSPYCATAAGLSLGRTCPPRNNGSGCKTQRSWSHVMVCRRQITDGRKQQKNVGGNMQTNSLDQQEEQHTRTISDHDRSTQATAFDVFRLCKFRVYRRLYMEQHMTVNHVMAAPGGCMHSTTQSGREGRAEAGGGRAGHGVRCL